MKGVERRSMRSVERAQILGRQGWCRLAASLIAIFPVVRVGPVLLSNWHTMPGWEAYWIAQALAAGKGYSFPFDVPWPLNPIGEGGFHASAWVDPLYTFVLAGLIGLFGSYHQLAAAVFNLALLLAVLGLTYRLAERLVSPLAGAVAVLVLAMNGPFSWTVVHMNNTMFATGFVLLSALMLVTFLDGPNHRRAAALGIVLGLSVLACPSAQLFIPVTVLVIGVLGWRRRGPSISHAIIVFALAVLCILPWTIRNYLALGTPVPVRTGLGQISFVGVVAAAGTVAPEMLPAPIAPPWRAATPRSAVKEMVVHEEKREALDRFLTDYTNAVGPQGYSAMNEAQRDAWLLQQTKTFLRGHPLISAQLGLAKLEVFVRIMGILGVLTCLMAAIGGLLSAKRPAALALWLWGLSFMGPFVVVICYWSRYRAPIEPIFVVLAVFAAWSVLEIGSRRFGFGWGRDNSTEKA